MAIRLFPPKGSWDFIRTTTATSSTRSLLVDNIKGNIYSKLVAIMRIINVTGSGKVFDLFINGDQTGTNYYAQKITGDGAAVAAGRENAATLVSTSANQETVIEADIIRDAFGRVRCMCKTDDRDAASHRVFLMGIMTVGTVAEITSIELRSQSAAEVMTGSTLTVYGVLK